MASTTLVLDECCIFTGSMNNVLHLIQWASVMYSTNNEPRGWGVWQVWHRVAFLSFRNWDRVLFWASNSGHPLSMYFDDFPGHYQPNSITFFSLIALKLHKQILKSSKRPWNMTYIGSNYTISRSIKFGVNFKIGTRCIFSREANWDRVRIWT